MTRMTTVEQVRLIDTYQRDAWEMFRADEEMGHVPGWYDPTVPNYWMVLPAERVHAAAAELLSANPLYPGLTL